MRRIRTAIRWTSKEDATLEREYRTGGLDAAAKALPSRSRQAIINHVSLLKLESDVFVGHKPWSPAEDGVVIDVYPDGGWVECAKRLPNRTRKAITNRYAVLRKLMSMDIDEDPTPWPLPVQESADTHRAWQAWDRRMAA